MKKLWIVNCLLLMLLVSNILNATSEKQSQPEVEAAQKFYQLGLDSLKKINGIKKDKEIAKEYFTRACNLGNGDGCWSLGNLYQLGKSLEQNDIKAAEYYEKAIKYFKEDCDLGNGYRCSFLGGRYRYGDGVEYNEEKSKKYYQKAITYHKKACELGDVDECLFLAYAYEDGIGIGAKQRSDTKAREFYQKACALGDKDSCERADILGDKK